MDFETYQSLYKKECPGCGEIYEAKRTNQTFCDQKCKNRYHNNRQRIERLRTQKVNLVTADINQVLWNNRELLKEYEGEHIWLSDFVKMGFNRSYITHFKQVLKNQMRFFVYDMAYEYHDAEENPEKKIIKIFNA